jgi:hypothetical protein
MYGILGVIFLPLGFIWAMNTLFAFAIGYTIQNWAAALILLIFFMRLNTNAKSK